ncbi:hypothetical protein AJ79_07358 [Helicocarpus griseus UAMH5409]|uniref:C6 finger domain transcription factor nscR n=1 Tax=Helicocarpus griseus UAMH5409 TaxID=1447875 RepID=A0A2B7X420_9EURO|nr:hypothetical protein AJ79_07358 [Helicocarpus griseus UAMH5409]
MRHARRKRRVTTCVPCYTRKQKCNRQYPCNHCTRRRRPEDCVYNYHSVSLDLSDLSSRSDPQADEVRYGSTRKDDNPMGRSDIPGTDGHSVASHGARGRLDNQRSAIAKSFGYFEDSNSNTMALLKSCDLNGDGDADVDDRNGSHYIWETIKQDLDRMPHRQVLDFLVQYFVYEINWIKQTIHALTFLAQYQKCAVVGDSLAKACLSLDWKGSLVRVQHKLLAALKCSCEGRTDKFWEGIASASRAAQMAGIHIDSPVPAECEGQEMEEEVRRRTFCCLYVLDSHLSRQLDRVPFLPDDLVEKTLPRLRLVPDIGDTAAYSNAPEVFSERLMQVQLGRFWRSFGPKRNSAYDPIQGEQRYERFCIDYLPTILPAFALEPDTKWDKYIPKLSMQRQLFHIAVFDSICWNFRPLLLLKQSHVASLAPYKQVLLQSQKKRLALAALKELEALSTLHSMMGGSHTRFGAIVFNTFEAAVLLLCLCSDADCLFDQGESSNDILGIKFGRITPEKLMQAAEKALGRLQMLAEVSDMAAAGAKVVTQLFVKVVRDKQGPVELAAPTASSHDLSWLSPFSNLLGVNDDSGNLASAEQHSQSLMSELVSSITYGDAYTELQIPPLDFNVP